MHSHPIRVGPLSRAAACLPGTSVSPGALLLRHAAWAAPHRDVQAAPIHGLQLHAEAGAGLRHRRCCTLWFGPVSLAKMTCSTGKQFARLSPKHGRREHRSCQEAGARRVFAFYPRLQWTSVLATTALSLDLPRNMHLHIICSMRLLGSVNHSRVSLAAAAVIQWRSGMMHLCCLPSACKPQLPTCRRMGNLGLHDLSYSVSNNLAGACPCNTAEDAPVLVPKLPAHLKPPDSLERPKPVSVDFITVFAPNKLAEGR